MDVTTLSELADKLLEQAREAHAGRAATTLHPITGGRLRQTLIAMTGDTALADHESPGEASIQVLAGSVSLTWSGDHLDLVAGQIAAIPPQRHGVNAREDSVVLLTVALAEPSA